MNASAKPNRVGAIARRLLARASVLGIASLALVLCGTVALVWAADPFGGKELAAKALSLKAAPKSATVTAGSAATFTLKVKPVTGKPKIKATGLPSGAAASFKTKLGKTKTAPAKVTMSVSTSASTPAGTYALKLSGKSGASKGSAAVTLTVQRGGSAPISSPAAAPTSTPPPPPPPAPTTEPPPSDRVFGATAVLPAPLVPGVPQKLDLLVQNLTTVDISIQGLTVGFDQVVTQAAPATPCGAADFAFTQLAGASGLTIPAGGSKRLSELGVAQASLPTVQLANRNVNQDGCQNAAATFAVQGTATGAKWTGNGSGTFNSVVGLPQLLTLGAALPSGQLIPGGSVTVGVTVANPNPFPMHVTAIALDTAAGNQGFEVDANHAACDLSALHLPLQTNGGAGWDVAPRVGGIDGSRTIDLENALSMDENAGDACQGANFTIHLKGSN